MAAASLSSIIGNKLQFILYVALLCGQVTGAQITISAEAGPLGVTDAAAVLQSPPGIIAEMRTPLGKTVYRLSLGLPLGDAMYHRLNIGLERNSTSQSLRLLHDRQNPQSSIPPFETRVVTHGRVTLGGLIGYEGLLTRAGRVKVYIGADLLLLHQYIPYTTKLPEYMIDEVVDYYSEVLNSIKPINYRARIGTRFTYWRFFVTYRYDILRPRSDHTTIHLRDDSYGTLSHYRGHIWTIGYSQPIMTREKNPQLNVVFTPE
jgi:hypothetical protein